MRWNSSYSTAGRSKNHFWRSLKLLRNLPIDLGFSKVSCSLVPFKCSTVQNESLYQVSPQGSLDVFSLFIASDSDIIILSFDGRFESRKFDEQWVFEDLLLHEKGPFLLHCLPQRGYRLRRSLRLLRNPPIDLGFSKVSCCLVPFKCSVAKEVSLSSEHPWQFGCLFIVFCFRLWHLFLRCRGPAAS